MSYVTGWIDVPATTATSEPAKKEEEPKTVPETIITPGMELKLSRVDLYASASAARYASKKTGTFYVYDGEVINNRIRITNSAKNVGKGMSYVTGWVNINDIK